MPSAGRVPAAVADYIRTQSTPLLAYAVLLTGRETAAEHLLAEAYADLAASWRRLRNDDVDRFVRRRIARRYLRAERRLFLRSRLPGARRSSAARTSSPPGAAPLAGADPLARLALLSGRERVVAVEVFAVGDTVASVADLLDSSPRSVHQTLDTALRRLGLTPHPDSAA